MKTRLVVTVMGLAMSLALPIFAQQQKAVAPEVRQQIDAAEMKFVEAYNKHEVATISALYIHSGRG